MGRSVTKAKVTFETSTHDGLRQLAFEKRTGVSFWVNRACKDFLKRMKKKEAA